MQQPTLRTSTRAGVEVVLRAHDHDDAPHLVRMIDHPDVQRWVSGPPVPFTAADARSWIAGRGRAWEPDRDTEWSWMVDLDGVPAGQLGLRPRGDGAIEVGFLLGTHAWGRGAMSAALREGARWAFRPRSEGGADARVLHWKALVGNWGSRRVAWSCGFRVEGLVRGLLPHRGEPLDGWTASLRRGDPLRAVVPWFEVPEIEVGDLLLRANLPADAERIVQACSHPSTRQWLADLPDPYTPAEAQAYLSAVAELHAVGGALHWAVTDADDPDRLLGQVALNGLGHGVSTTGEVGYWVHPDSRGRGVATRAVRAASRHGLLALEEGGLGLRRLLLRAAEGNTASCAIARAVGFTEVGRDRDGVGTRRGAIADHLRFDLLAEEMDAALAHPSSLR